MMLAPATRKRILKRDRCCQDCGRTNPDWRGWTIHHIHGKGMGGRKGKTKLEYDSDDNLLKLCARCHAARHGIKEV